MPKLEPKAVQKELDSGKVRPVYFLYGSERMKVRELQRRIQKAALKNEAPNDFNFERLDGSEIGIEAVLDSAQSFSMMGGTKMILVRNVEDQKNLDPLAEHLKNLPFSMPVDPSELGSVLVLVSKNFDGRKKASKVISEVAALVDCEEVKEEDREPWIDYLANRRGLKLEPTERLSLRGLEPWSLDIVDQEIAKLELVGEDPVLRSEALMSGISAYARDEFINHIFTRNLPGALSLVHLFSRDMEVQLPFLGLLSWNLRHLKLFIMEQEMRSRSTERRNPFLQRNLDRWRRYWTMASIQDFEHALFEIDFSLKNTRSLHLGIWTDALLKATGRKPA
jgi:DNA polymerase-3 subunit delta